jgi:hypothetical protein
MQGVTTTFGGNHDFLSYHPKKALDTSTCQMQAATQSIVSWDHRLDSLMGGSAAQIRLWVDLASVYMLTFFRTLQVHCVIRCISGCYCSTEKA